MNIKSNINFTTFVKEIKQNISLHIIEIFKGKELEKTSTIKKYLTVQKECNREVSRELEHYNLDVIISVGYKINSIKATKFRQWATGLMLNVEFSIFNEKKAA